MPFVHKDLHPSFKCTHINVGCTCTTHPTHAKGRCKELDHTDGKTLSISGDCTATGKNWLGLEFGMYAFHENPGDGWQLVDSALELNERHAEFIRFYNAHNGIPAIKNFASTNCCWTLRSGMHLLVDGSYVLPAQAGAVSCRPAGGFSGAFKFYNHWAVRSTLPAHTTKFSEGTQCGRDGANPGLYYRGAMMPPPSTPLQFGMFAFHEQPVGGWQLVDTAEELNNRRADFVSFYNTHGGIPAIRNFASTNCCWTLRSGKRLLIDNGVVLPAQAGAVSCRPAGGFMGSFKFYNNRATRWTLPDTVKFSESAACGRDGANPALYYKEVQEKV